MNTSCIRLSENVMMKIYDISHTVCEGMTVWPGDPEFRLRRITQIRKGESSNVSAFEIGTHTGTHVDAPLHLDDNSADVASMPLRNFLGPVRVFSIEAEGSIRVADLQKLDWRGVERALFKTRAARIRESSFDPDFACLDEEAAAFLVSRRILLVGIDTPSVDAFSSKTLPVHRKLLNHGIAILENARLDEVPPDDYELLCQPLKLDGLDGSPVRAILSRE